MHEELLHFAYQYKLYEDAIFFNTELCKILDIGKPNFDAGPDFIGAKLQTKEAIWAGNVEIHTKSSDWNLHKHNLDKAYNNVILHVVSKHDCDVFTENGRLLTVLQIKLPENIIEKYNNFKQQNKHIPCADYIRLVNSFKLKMWLSKILVQRLHNKVEYVRHVLKASVNDWETVFYQSIARGFGLKINSLAFEKLAKSVSTKIIAKHNNIFQLEAVFMGQAGFLNDENIEDDYFKQLRQEYLFLKNKFNLQAMEKHEWKFLRLRPSNFPTIRIAQFADFMSKNNSLFSKLVNSENIDDLKKIFEVKASKYWDCHYTFAKKSKKKQTKEVGTQSINSILINSFIPCLFAYGEYTGNDKLKERSISFLENIKPEKNKIISEWKELGIKSSSAFDTQSLIEQYNSYCNKNKCLKCGIGVEILKNK